MSPLDIIKEIKERLDVLDFEKLWPQLKRYPFALVSEELVYFESGKIIEKDNSFLGNTAIAYEESYLAIWQLEFAMDDLDGWTAQIVHEMVHANQYQAKDSRFVKDLKMLDYPNDLSNYQNKAQENIILVNDEVDAITRLSQIIASRKRRYESLKDYQYAESMIETIEGLAEYIALKVLKQLKPKKAI